MASSIHNIPSEIILHIFYYPLQTRTRSRTGKEMQFLAVYKLYMSHTILLRETEMFGSQPADFALFTNKEFLHNPQYTWLHIHWTDSSPGGPLFIMKGVTALPKN